MVFTHVNFGLLSYDNLHNGFRLCKLQIALCTVVDACYNIYMDINF